MWYNWSKQPREPSLASKSSAVTESLLTEMDYHIRIAEQRLREKEEEDRKSRRGADYSWLVGTNIQHYTVPELQRMDLEDLCAQIKPSECSNVISIFRDALLNEPSPVQIPDILRAVLNQVLSTRAQSTEQAGMASWMMKSLTRLTAHHKIRPLTEEASTTPSPTQHNAHRQAWVEADPMTSNSEVVLTDCEQLRTELPV